MRWEAGELERERRLGGEIKNRNPQPADTSCLNQESSEKGGDAVHLQTDCTRRAAAAVAAAISYHGEIDIGR